MGGFWWFVDVFLFLYFFVIAFATAVFVQTCIPARFFPYPLVKLNSWVARGISHYLIAEKLSFYEGTSRVVLLVQWPAAVASVSGYLACKPWVSKSCLIYGVSMLCCLIVTLTEMIKFASCKLLIFSWLLSWPFMGVVVLAIMPGLVCPNSATNFEEDLINVLSYIGFGLIMCCALYFFFTFC